MANVIRAGTALAAGVALTGLDFEEFWLAYFALGGNCSPTELRSYLAGSRAWPVNEHDIAVLAVNERCVDMDLGQPGLYAREFDLRPGRSTNNRNSS